MVLALCVAAYALLVVWLLVWWHRVCSFDRHAEQALRLVAYDRYPPFVGPEDDPQAMHAIEVRAMVLRRESEQ